MTLTPGVSVLIHNSRSLENNLLSLERMSIGSVEELNGTFSSSSNG